MDKLIYVSMAGAKAALQAQAANSHNLANINTTGFRADLSAFEWRGDASTAKDGALSARALGGQMTQSFNEASGSLQATGRDLDVAVNGQGWFAVQDASGNEAYTRAGDFRLDTNGTLRNGSGREVLGEGGSIVIPPNTSITIASNGDISIVPLGQGSETTAVIGRLKLVNPPPRDLERGSDGLFRLRAGDIAPSDPTVQVVSGTLEASNVNGAQAIVNMIELSRQFEMQMRTIKWAEENSRSSGSLLNTR
jgi:flagellar basal-body rod protein FlgF